MYVLKLSELGRENGKGNPRIYLCYRKAVRSLRDPILIVLCYVLSQTTLDQMDGISTLKEAEILLYFY